MLSSNLKRIENAKRSEGNRKREPHLKILYHLLDISESI
jgi:hypothetical protein